MLHDKDLLAEKPCRHWWTKDGLEEVKTMHREHRLGGSYGKEVVDDLQVWPLVQFIISKIIISNVQKQWQWPGLITFQYVFDTHVNMTGKHVLVIGSERPWIEAILLLSGANHVTSLDYIPDLKSSHPQVG